MKVLDLFSGIGGFSLGLERAGLETVAFVEIDEYCQKVLKKHWPDVPIFSDIKTFGRSVFEESVDLICGGFPCQPFSVAGKRKGTDDNRHLWPEMLRVIQDFKPSWVVAENVRGILSIEQGMVFEQVCLGLENEGYQVQPFVVPACAVNAPHRRDRVWIIGYSNKKRKLQQEGLLKDERKWAGNTNQDVANSQRLGREKGTWKGIQPQEQITKGQDAGNINTERDVVNTNNSGSRIKLRNDRNGQEKGEEWQRFAQLKFSKTNQDVADPTGKGLEGEIWTEQPWFRGRPSPQDRGQLETWNENWYEVATRFCRVDDGVSNRVDRLKCLGNAVVPQIVEVIGRTIITNIQ